MASSSSALTSAADPQIFRSETFPKIIIVKWVEVDLPPGRLAVEPQARGISLDVPLFLN